MIVYQPYSQSPVDLDGQVAKKGFNGFKKRLAN